MHIFLLIAANNADASLSFMICFKFQIKMADLISVFKELLGPEIT